jgi:hypothetical protein
MIRLGILRAAPLVMLDNGQRCAVPELDFAAEYALILQGLAESGRAVEVRVEPATTAGLQTLLSLRYDVLHIRATVLPTTWLLKTRSERLTKSHP